MQDAGDRRQEKEDTRPETGDGRQKAENSMQDAGCRRQETEDGRQNNRTSSTEKFNPTASKVILDAE